MSQRFPYRQLYNISAKGSGRAWTIRDVAILAEITLREGPSLRRVGVSGAATMYRRRMKKSPHRAQSKRTRSHAVAALLRFPANAANSLGYPLQFQIWVGLGRRNQIETCCIEDRDRSLAQTLAPSGAGLIQTGSRRQ